jgi:hypothetical protein
MRGEKVRVHARIPVFCTFTSVVQGHWSPMHGGPYTDMFVRILKSVLPRFGGNTLSIPNLPLYIPAIPLATEQVPLTLARVSRLGKRCLLGGALVSHQYTKCMDLARGLWGKAIDMWSVDARDCLWLCTAFSATNYPKQ